MQSTRFSGRRPPSLTARLFGLLYDCPGTCGTACPFRAVRQIDHATTFAYLRSLTREDKLLLLQQYQHCPVRLGMGRRERRRGLPRDVPDVRLARRV